MLRRLICTAYLLCFFALLWSCVHTTKEKQESLIFKNPQFEKRAMYLQHKLRTNPNDVESRMELGRIFLSEDMIEDAVVEFEKILSIDSHHIQTYLLLSLAIQRRPTPDFFRALTLLENASQINPNNADVHLNLAQVLNKLNNEEKAIKEFKKTITLSTDPATLVSAHLGLMAIYKRQGDIVKANAEYKAAYKIYPELGEIIEQAEINHVTKTPKYVGEEIRDDGYYPSFEKRIKRVKQEIEKLSKGEE